MILRKPSAADALIETAAMATALAQACISLGMHLFEERILCGWSSAIHVSLAVDLIGNLAYKRIAGKSLSGLSPFASGWPIGGG